MFYLLLVLLLAAMLLPIKLCRGRRALGLNLSGFVAGFLALAAYVFMVPVQAAEAAGGDGTTLAAALVGAGITTGLACVGAGIATGQAASAAIGAVSEDEKMMGKSLIFVAMAEGIAIYGLLISFMILNRA